MSHAQPQHVPGPPDPQTGNSIYTPHNVQAQINPFAQFQPSNNRQAFQGNNQSNMIHPQMPQAQQNQYAELPFSDQISPLIHNEYGEKFHRTQKTTPNAYQACLTACGGCISVSVVSASLANVVQCK